MRGKIGLCMLLGLVLMLALLPQAARASSRVMIAHGKYFLKPIPPSASYSRFYLGIFVLTA